MIIKNKEVIQSYLITAARYDFSVHEKRIIYRLVEMCQFQIEGKKLNPNYMMDKTLFGDYIIKMPIGGFLAHDEDHNHDKVKDALRRLRNKTIEYDDGRVWKLIGIIEKPKFDKYGFVSFEVQPEIYDAILNFSKGFRRIELATAMQFESVYSMRFYELLSGKFEPITYSINDLKIMFQVENKYKQINDFIKRTIDPARKELAEKAPFSFTYKTNKAGKKIVSITFFPYLIPTNADEDLERQQLQKQLSLRWSLDKMVVDYLKQNYLFDNDEIKHNMDTFKAAHEKLDIMNFLSNKRRAAAQKVNPKGWLIGAIKRELAAKEKQNQVEKIT